MRRRGRTVVAGAVALAIALAGVALAGGTNDDPSANGAASGSAATGQADL